MFDDVLIATDGSDVASTAVEQGIEIAASVGATVHVLYVSVREVPADGDATTDSERAPGREIVDEAARAASERGLEVEPVVRTGRAHLEILEYATECDVDVLVIGTRGRTELRETGLGSVAARVIRDAARPVLTVSPNVSLVSWSITDVLVPTDGMPGSTAAIECGVALASRYDARVHALYVVDDTVAQSTSHLALLRRIGDRATNDAAARASKENVPTIREIGQGMPHEEILSYVDTNRANVVVIGAESRTGLDRFILGSVTERVICRAPVPVLTVRSFSS